MNTNDILGEDYSNQTCEIGTSPDTLSFYDKSYYETHYAFLLEDEEYYHLISEYWKYEIFVKNLLNTQVSVLDYGCGLGQVTSALPNVTFFDTSKFAKSFLQNFKKCIISDQEVIPTFHFDYVFSSHSLEHYPTPVNELMKFHRYTKSGGKLVLVLPIETSFSSTLRPDSDQHFYAWTFQTITNLLLHCNWQPERQAVVYNPFALRTLSRLMKLSHSHEARVIRLSSFLGNLKKSFPSMLIVAGKIE